MRYHDLQEFISHSEHDDGDLEAARQHLLWKILAEEKQQTTEESASGNNTLIFTNSIASADSLFDFLREQQQSDGNPSSFPCVLFHKEIDRSERQKVLAQLDDERSNVVVVCTDIAARGLDTTKVWE